MPRIWSALPTVIAVAALVIAAWGQLWQDHGADVQEQRTTIAAVIDYQRILRDAAAARSIRDQIEARRKAYQEEISKEERRLHEADKAFAEQRSVLSAEALAEKRREFEQDVVNVQRLVQERRRELDRLSAAALNEVEKALIEIVKSTAEDLGLTLVLPSSEVLFFARSLDLTEEVLAKLDASLPDIQLSQIAD